MKCKAYSCFWFRLSLPWLLIVLVVSYAGWQVYNSQIEAERQHQQAAALRATQLAEVMAAHSSSIMAAIDMGLQQVRKGWLQSPEDLALITESVLSNMPQGLVAYLSVIDAEGYTIYTSLNTAAPGTYMGDSEHFIGQQHGDDQLVIGPPDQAPLVDGWTFIVNRPLLRDGRFAGTVNMSVRTDVMAQILRRASLNATDVVALLRHDGTFLARSLENNAAMGQSVNTARPFLIAGGQSRGTFIEGGTLDQVLRLFSWQRLPEHGLILVVGLDEAAILAPLRLNYQQDLSVLLLLLASLILIAILLSVLFWRDLQQQRRQHDVQQSMLAINQAQSRFINGDSANAVFNELLAVLLQLTDSEYGFIGEVMYNQDGQPYLKAHGLSNIAWNEETRRLYADNVENGLDFHNMDTLFGRVVTERKLVIANQVLSDQRRSVLPHGHPPLRRFMGIPLYHNDSITGVIALANRTQPYDAALLTELTPLMTACDNLFGSMRRERQRLAAERQVVELNKTLEQRVEMRTRELERASAAKNEFLSRMSHELRTPLNAILGFTQLLQPSEAQSLNAQQTANVQEIYAAGEHLLALVNEILDLASIESGQLTLNPEPLALQPLLEHCVAQIFPLAKERGIEPELIIQQPCTVMADPTRLKQVLLNLLSNAVKYNTEGGSLTVESMPVANQQVRINVRDTGQGLSDEQLARLFQPFERLESAYNGIEGMGIGLALAKQLVEGMQGRIGAGSTPGQGSCFWFELPVCQAPALVTPPKETAPDVTTNALAAKTGHTVLYIEDNPANLRLVQKILARHSEFTLLTADSGEQGIALALEKLPDLILLDINMPGMDGFAVLQQLQENPLTRHLPVIAISANAMQRDIARGKEAGFVDYITKPIQVPAFLQSIKHCLQSKPQPLDCEDPI